MPLDPSIALSYRPIEVADPMAQYAQIAQIQHYQNQNQVAQMQFEKMRQHENYLTKMQEAISKNGGPDLMTAASLMAQSPDQNVQMHGIQMLQAQQELAAYNKKFGAPTTATGGFGGGALVPSGALGSGTFGINPEPAPMNALAPKVAPTPSKNALTVDVNSLRQELMDLSQYPNVPQAKLRANIIQEQLKEVMKAHVVPNVGLVSGAGQTIVASGMAPTDIKRLTAERDALPVGDPNRKLYDQAIADIGATARVAQQRLAFDKSKFEFEKANPGYELKETEDGSIVGVNKRTLQSFPVTVGGAGAPATVAPAVGGGIPTGRTAPVGQPTGAPVEGAPMAGTPLKGKATALTESQGNATAYGMRMKESNAILEDMSKKGVLRGANIESTPLVGESLGKVLPSVLGGTSGPQQQVSQAKSNFITAVLRKESGAVISDSEFEREDKKYFPQLNDSPEVIKQKSNARKLAIKSMEIQAGPGAKNIKEYIPSIGASASETNPLGLPGI